MKYLFSERFLQYIEWAIIIQLIVVALFVIGIYGAKIYLILQKRWHNKQHKALVQQLTEIVNGNAVITPHFLKLARHNVTDVLVLIKKLDAEHNSDIWRKAKLNIAENVLMPVARRYSHSKSWYKNYIATQCYHVYLPGSEEANLMKLIESPALLVSINAAEVVVKHPSQALIDAIIDNFSETRHVRQTSYAQILTSHSPVIDKYFLNRIEREQNPYVKAFCYRMLKYLPKKEAVIPRAYEDIDSVVFELSVAALKYLAHVLPVDDVKQTLLQKLNSEVWQIRSAAVKLLGRLKVEESAELIAEKLRDPEWWVRMQAARALTNLGEKGIELLQKQDPHIDRYAYEVAEQTLKTFFNHETDSKQIQG